MVEFIYNQHDSHSKELKTLIPVSDKIVLCAAYWRANGLSKIRRELIRATKNKNVSIEIFVGLDEKITEYDALEGLFELSNKYVSIKVRACWMSKDKRGPIFHSKVFYFNNGKIFTAIVGSANLTKNGLDNNSESSIIYSDSINIEFDDKIQQYFDLLREADYTYDLDRPLIDTYKSWEKWT